MTICTHPNARKSRVHPTRWWCPDCRKHVLPPDPNPANEYERVARRHLARLTANHAT